MDVPVIVARKLLFKAIRDLQEGREPANVVRDPKRNRFLIDASDDLVPASTPWKEYIKEKTMKLEALLSANR